MKKFVIIFCLLIFVVQVIQIIYFQRSAFTEKYDISYWKDRYEHSQYQLPLSKRIVGDDGLYAYIGYQLVKGGNPAGENAQAPPIGKYLIGLSILIFRSPVYYAFFLGLGSIVIFYFLSRFFLKNNIDAVFVSTLLLLDPLYFSQLWKPWLDIAQLFFLLLNLLFLICMEKSTLRRRIIYAVLGGFSLGFFIETKTPILLPIILSIETIYFLRKGFKKEYVVFLIGIILAIFSAYTKYFLLGHSLIDFLKLQKYIVSFWLQTKLDVHMNAIWQTLLFGKFPHITTGIPSIVPEWWIIWPIITILGVSAIYWIFSKKDSLIWKGGAVFILGSLIIYTFIPSYPRYLLIVLPFLYLFSIKALNNFVSTYSRRFLYMGILLYGLLHATAFLLPSSDFVLDDFYYNFKHQYFQDIYQQDIAKYKSLLISRSDFRLISQKALLGAEVDAIDIKEISKNFNKNNSKGKVKVKVIYKTRNLGEFFQIKDLGLRMENGKWKIVWNWNLILDGFLPNYMVQTERILGRRGLIVDSSGRILAQDYEGYLVSVNPEKIDLKKEPKMLDFISSIGDVKAPHLQNAYLENSLSGNYIPLVTVFYPLDLQTKTKFLSFPGVRITPYPSRIFLGINPLSLKNSLYEECCTRIYSKNYHGVSGLEKDYDELLSGGDGGSIVIKDGKGNIVKTVFKKEAKIGQDVIVPL